MVTYAAFAAARATAVYPNHRFRAEYAARLACVPISPFTGRLIKSLFKPRASGNTAADAKGRWAAQVLEGLPGAGGLALKIGDKYAYSYLFTKVRFFDDRGEEMDPDRKLKVGEEFTVEVTHWYTLVVPLINRLLATKEISVPGTPVKNSIPRNILTLAGAQAGKYYFPVRAHTTMKVEDDL